MAKIRVGDRVPVATFKTLGPGGIASVESAALFTGRRVLVIGVIGAFTPVCTERHLPEFLPYCKTLRDANVVDEILCLSVADPFALRAWGTQLGVGDRLRFLTDTNAAFAKAMGLDLDLSASGLGVRSTRYLLFVDNGIVQLLNVETDPHAVDVTSGATAHRLLIKG